MSYCTPDEDPFAFHPEDESWEEDEAREEAEFSEIQYEDKYEDTYIEKYCLSCGRNISGSPHSECEKCNRKEQDSV